MLRADEHHISGVIIFECNLYAFLQCSDLVAVSEWHYGADDAKKLRAKLNNMHIFIHDMDRQHKAHWQPDSLKQNTHYFPYKV